MLRVGIVGLGRHGRRYAEHLARGEVRGARLAGFWRRDAAKAAEDARALGAPALPTPEAVVEASDVVVVVVPAALHLELASKVADAGRPLLLEKPLSVTAADGARIIARFGPRGRLMVAQTIRFDPLTERLRAAQGALGRLRGFGLEQRLEPRGLAWENEQETAGGGVVLQTGVHAIDALRFVTGARVRLVGAELAHVHGKPTEDQAWLRLAVGDTHGDLRTSKIGRGRRHRYTFFFDDGAVEADYVTRRFDDGRAVQEVPAEPTVVRTLEAFLAWVRGELERCPVPPEEALEALEVIDAAYLRARALTAACALD